MISIELTVALIVITSSLTTFVFVCMFSLLDKLKTIIRNLEEINTSTKNTEIGIRNIMQSTEYVRGNTLSSDQKLEEILRILRNHMKEKSDAN